MIRLIESVRSDLYHVTNINNLMSILDSNKLIKSTSRNKNIKPDGVSFTRDINFTKNYFKNSVVLVLDGEEISYNYKLKPVTDHPNGLKSRYKGNSKAEEVLVDKDLNNLSRYLKKIIVYEDYLNQDMIDKLEDIHNKYSDIKFELR